MVKDNDDDDDDDDGGGSDLINRTLRAVPRYFG
jgi:hypothetical protein